MKALIIYASQTGFTQKYATLLSEKVQGDLLTLREAKKQADAFFDKYDAIVFGGWVMAGSTVYSKWFLEKAEAWKGKKLALFCVGATPAYAPDVAQNLHKLLTDEQRGYIKAFYCQGGLNYAKMNLPSRLSMKALATAMKKKKGATPQEKEMAAMIAQSFDSFDEHFLEPIIAYLQA